MKKRLRVDASNDNCIVDVIDINQSELFAQVKDVLTEETYITYKTDLKYINESFDINKFINEGIEKMKSKSTYDKFVDKLANVSGKVADDVADMLRHALKLGFNKTFGKLLGAKDFSLTKVQNYLKKMYQHMVDRNIQDLEIDKTYESKNKLVYEISGTIKNVIMDSDKDIEKILKSVNREIARIFIKNDKLSIKVYDKIIKKTEYKDLDKWKITFEIIFEITFSRKDEDGDFYITYKGKDSKIDDDMLDSIKNNLYKAYYRALEFIYL